MADVWKRFLVVTLVIYSELRKNYSHSIFLHVFWNFNPNYFETNFSHPYPIPDDSHGKNTVRMAEVWMDDYKKYFYLSRVELKGKEVGDLSKRKHLREELACHSFDWYLDNIIPHKYRMDRDSKLWGRLRSHKHPSLCIDHLQRDEAHKLKTYTLGKILILLVIFI